MTKVFKAAIGLKQQTRQAVAGTMPRFCTVSSVNGRVVGVTMDGDSEPGGSYPSVTMSNYIGLRGLLVPVQGGSAYFQPIGSSYPIGVHHSDKGDSIEVGRGAIIDSAASEFVAIGWGAKVAGTFPIAIGWNSEAMAMGGVAIGRIAKAESGVALGYGAAGTLRGHALGKWSVAADASLAVGEVSKATGYISTALGYGAKATGQGAISIGYQESVSGEASGESSVAMSWGALATGKFAMAFGQTSKATNQDGIAMGRSANAGGLNAIALGAVSSAGSEGNIAIGFSASTSLFPSIAIGYMAKAIHSYSWAIGYAAEASQAYAGVMRANAVEVVPHNRLYSKLGLRRLDGTRVFLYVDNNNALQINTSF